MMAGNYIVALRAKGGEFSLFVESFDKENGKAYLKHTTDIAAAKRYPSWNAAEEILEELKEHHCTGRVEKVMAG